MYFLSLSLYVPTNKLPSISQDIAKRVLICRIDTKIDREVGVKNSRRVNESMRNIGTAFFSEYVGRMIPVVLEMAEMMKQSEDNLEYFPDILAESSKVIYQMIKELLLKKYGRKAKEFGNNMHALIKTNNYMYMLFGGISTSVQNNINSLRKMNGQMY